MTQESMLVRVLAGEHVVTEPLEGDGKFCMVFDPRVYTALKDYHPTPGTIIRFRLEMFETGEIDDPPPPSPLNLAPPPEEVPIE